MGKESFIAITNAKQLSISEYSFAFISLSSSPFFLRLLVYTQWLAVLELISKHLDIISNICDQFISKIWSFLCFFVCLFCFVLLLLLFFFFFPFIRWISLDIFLYGVCPICHVGSWLYKICEGANHYLTILSKLHTFSFFLEL